MSNPLVSQYAQYEEISYDRIRGASDPQDAYAASSRIHADMHLGVYTSLLSIWAAFLSLFWMTFYISAQTDFLMGFILLFAIVAFGLPAIMNRTGHFLPGTTGSFRDFLNCRVATIDGSVRGIDALIQVILVPACLTVGGIVIAFIIATSRFSY